MATDEQIMNQINRAFAEAQRPEHFTNYAHCCECAEHDEVLRSRDRETLGFEDVGSPAWDPTCFLTSEGFRYYLPALIRLALAEPDATYGWYLPQLLFHLIADGERNRRFLCCSPEQRRAIVELLWHVVETRWQLVSEHWAEYCEDQLQRAIEIWSDEGG